MKQLRVFDYFDEPEGSSRHASASFVRQRTTRQSCCQIRQRFGFAQREQ